MFQPGTAPVLSAAPFDGVSGIIGDAGDVIALREKSLTFTDYLITLIDE